MAENDKKSPSGTFGPLASDPEVGSQHGEANISLNSLMVKVMDRLDRIDNKLERIDAKFERIDAKFKRIEELDSRFEKLRLGNPENSTKPLVKDTTLQAPLGKTRSYEPVSSLDTSFIMDSLLPGLDNDLPDKVKVHISDQELLVASTPDAIIDRSDPEHPKIRTELLTLYV
ncbi:hypothetical protein DICA0_B12992 [Diutina catenulata]